MIMRLVVPVITALVLIAVGVFWMFMMLVGTNGYNSSTGGKILVGNLVLVILTIIISSLASGWLAHVLQKRSGISPWIVAPLTVVTVTVVAVVALFFVGVLIVAVVDATR
jgi:membrane protease YdiL (CAAX protease family)